MAPCRFLPVFFTSPFHHRSRQILESSSPSSSPSFICFCFSMPVLTPAFAVAVTSTREVLLFFFFFFSQMTTPTFCFVDDAITQTSPCRRHAVERERETERPPCLPFHVCLPLFSLPVSTVCSLPSEREEMPAIFILCLIFQEPERESCLCHPCCHFFMFFS